jgi:hypothetical protein
MRTIFLLDEICIETLRIIDKLRKIGEEGIRTLLLNFWDEDTTNSIIALVTKDNNNELTLKKLSALIPVKGTHSKCPDVKYGFLYFQYAMPEMMQ